jgi:hypothetical protein
MRRNQSSEVDQGGATTQQQTMRGQKRGGPSTRVVLASIVLILLVLGGLTITFTSYPMLQVMNVSLSGQERGSLIGTMTVRISGGGTFHLQHVEVTAGPLSTCSVQVLFEPVHEMTFGLPMQMNWVTKCIVIPSLLNLPLVVSIDGTWTPADGLTIPVHLSAEKALQRQEIQRS